MQYFDYYLTFLNGAYKAMKDCTMDDVSLKDLWLKTEFNTSLLQPPHL